MQHVVQIDLPVRLGVRRQRKIFASLLACHAHLNSFVVNSTGFGLERDFCFGEFFSGLDVEESLAALTVRSGLLTPLIDGRRLGGVDRQRVPRAVLVDVGRAVADPLPPAVHWNAAEEFHFGHFERGRVAMPHQISDQGAVVGDFFRALAITDSSRLDD